MNRIFWKELWMLLIFTFLGIVSMVATLGITALLAHFVGQNDTLELHVGHWWQMVFVMFLPALLWYRLRMKGNALEAFGFKHIDWRMMALTCVLMLVSYPLVEFITFMNYSIPLPESWREHVISAKVGQYELMGRMLAMNGVWGWIENIALVCVATAIAEETMFRGAIYKCFGLTRLNKHLIAMGVGLLFSMAHFDISGFLARWIMGTALCYLVIYGRSIWPAILAHAMNNLFALIQFKMLPEGYNAAEPAEYDFGWFWLILSIAATGVVLKWMKAKVLKD